MVLSGLVGGDNWYEYGFFVRTYRRINQQLQETAKKNLTAENAKNAKNTEKLLTVKSLGFETMGPWTTAWKIGGFATLR